MRGASPANRHKEKTMGHDIRGTVWSPDWPQRCRSRKNSHPKTSKHLKGGCWHTGQQTAGSSNKNKRIIYLTTEYQSTCGSGSRLHFSASNYWTSDRAVKLNKASSLTSVPECQKELPKRIKRGCHRRSHLLFLCCSQRAVPVQSGTVSQACLGERNWAHFRMIHWHQATEWNFH